MKRGYYCIDVNRVGKANLLIYEGKYIPSWRHKQIRDMGKEVWYSSGDGRWSFSPLQGVTRKADKPKVVTMLELMGAL